MNYRHAFHAGNFADVLKHAVLARVLVYLTRKESPFRFIDTHAGAGRYDLKSEAATRSPEWRDGIARVLTARPPAAVAELLGPYLKAVGPYDVEGRPLSYPGSPAVAQALMRLQDRIALSEANPLEREALIAALGRDRRLSIVGTDGYVALNAYLPPKERRGLVLIDPAFEATDEADHVVRALERALRKWPTGIYLLWYPIKDRDAPDALARRLRKLALPNLLRSEIMVAPAHADSGLAGSGLILLNPPFKLDAELRARLPELGRIMSPKAACAVDWLTKQT